jgi:hypothetical protein
MVISMCLASASAACGSSASIARSVRPSPSFHAQEATSRSTRVAVDDRRDLEDDTDADALARRRRCRANQGVPAAQVVEQIPQGEGPLDQPGTELTVATDVQLGSQPVTVPVAMPESGSVVLNGASTTIALTPAMRGARYLALQGIRTDGTPGVVYSIYLGGVDAQHFVGTLNFYGAELRALDTSYDIGPLIRAVQAAGGPWELSIVANGTPAPNTNSRIARVFFAVR